MSTQIDDAGGKIQFVQYHSPGIASGDYVITVTQELAICGTRPQDPFSTQWRFAVYGERFTLKPADIQALFPPDGNLGEHSNVLPHLILSRSTLPWERQADAGRTDVPWLALLLFDAPEAPTPQIVKLSDLLNPTSSSAKFPTLYLESGQTADDQITVIDVKQSVLQALLPTADELGLLAHVRVSRNGRGEQQEQAVIIGNRLPRYGSTSTVHLVSLEGRYSNGSFVYQGAGGDDLFRLVSLKSWSFSCIDEKQSFKGLLQKLDRTPGTLRLPSHAAPEVEAYLSQGSLLLPHTLRQAGRTLSWYHGPLVPAENKVQLPLPVGTADALVRYYPTTGLFDISYAAAWQLGNLLALQSKQFSTNLYLWKRTHAQQLRQVEQQLRYASLPLQGQSVDASEQFTAISSWFANISLLQGVPFNYLVPAEHMLPKEAIRFFWVDAAWIDCLLDGAFSIGRVTTSDYAQAHSQTANNSSPATNPYAQLTGFLMRSEVIAGWPGLRISGNDSSGKSLPLLRMDRLSPNVLICLFAGEIASVAVSLKPETLHFGLDTDSHIPPIFSKILRDGQGNEQQALTATAIPWKQGAQRTLDIAALAQQIQQKTGITPFSAATFALQMVEGAEEVIFQKGG